MGRRKTSVIWDYFTEEKISGNSVWRCTICKNTSKLAGNTSNMWSHLKTYDDKHREVYTEIKPLSQPARKKKKVSPSKQTRLLDNESHSTDVENDNSDEECHASLEHEERALSTEPIASTSNGNKCV